MKSYRKRKISIIFTLLSFAIMMLLCFCYSNTLAYTEKNGTINGTYVNIRTSAGTKGNTNKLTHNGAYVQLNVGHVVRVIGEENASDGSLWYKINFTHDDGTKLSGYVHSDYVTVNDVEYEYDATFESYLTSQNFPESYKDGLRTLHAKYPNWVFVADQISLDYDEVVQNESIGGRNLVSKNAITSWKSLDADSYNWESNTWILKDGQSWVSASKDIISYFMDPRNFLDEVSVFQFEMQSYNEKIHTLSGVSTMLTGSFMSNVTIENGKTYAQVFMEAAKKADVSPYLLASRVIQEIGKVNPSSSATGEYYSTKVGDSCKGYYNFYNIHAYEENGYTPIENGLLFASKTDSAHLRPWNTRYKAIIGGALYIGEGYINKGQDTTYYQKFNVMGDKPYSHQYMTNIQAPSSEAVNMSKAYSNKQKTSLPLVFRIPVYENMPESACKRPTDDRSPNNVLRSLTVDGYSLTPVFSSLTSNYELVVPYEASYINIDATKVDASASISGIGKKSLSVGMNTVIVSVTAQNGDVRKYKLSIERKQQEIKAQYQTSLNIIDDIYLSGIALNSSVNDIYSKFTLKYCKISVYKEDGKTPLTSKVTTGTVVKITDNQTGTVIKQYILVVYGDVNGDGNVNIYDLEAQQSYILGKEQLKGAHLFAADVTKSNGVNIEDMLCVQRHILGKEMISQ